MKRFHYAIKAIENELLRCVGKFASDLVDKKRDPKEAFMDSKVKNLKAALKILDEHPENKHV